MHGWRPVQIGLMLCLVVGCTSIPSNQHSVDPSLLKGDSAEVQQRLLTHIPIGTPQLEAEQLVKSFGFELTPESELGFDSHDSINCRLTVRKGLFGQAVWIIQIECTNGTVSDIICEQMGVSYW